MFSTIVSGLRAWRVSLCGAIIAGLLLGTPFTSNPGNQCYAKGKGGGHHSGGHKGHKARNKRHGPKRHHAGHHSAKKHRHAKRREHHPHKSHGKDWSHHSSTTDITHHHNGWDYYWGHHDYVAPDIVGPDVVGSEIVTPSVIVKKVYIVRLYAPGDRRNHIEEVVGSTYERVKERVLKKYADADFKSIHEKPAVGGEDVYVAKFSTSGDEDHVEDILASTGEKAKEKVLEKYAHASFKSVEVKRVIDAR